MEKIKIMFCSFPDYSSNAKPLYEYMLKKYSRKMELVWAVSSEEVQQKLKEKDIVSYVIGTDEYFDYCKDVDVFFTTHANIVGEKNSKSLYIELWHGLGPKQSGFLSGNVTDDERIWYSNISEKIDYFILPSDFWRVIFSTILNFDYCKTVSLGYPKLDYFKDEHAKEKLAKVLNRNIDSYDKIIYYMPTFRKGCARGTAESKFNVEDAINIESYSDDELNEFLKKNNYLLCIKKHPSEELESKFKDRDNIITIHEKDLADNMITINEILNASDLMITDYSSLGVEYLYLKKPVLYITTDEEEYKNNRGIIFNDLDFWMPGYRAKNITSLKDGIINSFSENFEYKEEIIKKSRLWFSDLKNGGCDNICNFIFNENGKVKEELLNKSQKQSYTTKLEEENSKLQNVVDEKNEVISQREARIKELDDFIAQIINSKGWRFLESMRGIKSKFCIKSNKREK